MQKKTKSKNHNFFETPLTLKSLEKNTYSRLLGKKIIIFNHGKVYSQN